MSTGTALPAAATGFWTLDRVADALRPHASGNLPIGSTQLHAVSTDTRQIQPGDLFVALSGERFDAHDFLSEAVGKGATARWVKDAAMKLYRKVLKRFAPGSDASDVYLVYGMAAAWTAVEALRRAGAEPTRERLVQVMGSLNLQANPFLLPGIALRTGPSDRFPIDQMLLQRWQKNAWRSFGGLWAYRGGG